MTEMIQYFLFCSPTVINIPHFRVSFWRLLSSITMINGQSDAKLEHHHAFHGFDKYSFSPN